ncbi:hypothetical protein [Methylocystis sp. ATCC 49242]|uniref:hypothetical protein n=1 Tax=Methylocystis sp. ATCC 49242 TaxID=622637 RepID=UPI0011847778|nr:hypothetical protein [Methylocystis sp. ATCC 49242]
MLPTPPAWGFSIFCDDIRQELHGKYSIIGVYASDLIFEGNFPLIIPKLGIVVKYYERADTKFSSDVILSVHMPSDADRPQSISKTIPRSAFASTPIDEAMPMHNGDDVVPMVSITVPFLLSPVFINSGGRIKVRATVGDEVVRLGTLIIRQAKEDESKALLADASQQTKS